jgi:hypothetical protein
MEETIKINIEKATDLRIAGISVCIGAITAGIVFWSMRTFEHSTIRNVNALLAQATSTN